MRLVLARKRTTESEKRGAVFCACCDEAMQTGIASMRRSSHTIPMWCRNYDQAQEQSAFVGLPRARVTFRRVTPM